MELPVYVLFASPRSGTDLFQSLLDSHPQILQLPGPFDFVDVWRSSLCHNDPEGFAYEFAWSNRGGRKSPLLKFLGRHNSFERWDRLGQHRDESFTVDADAFARHFVATVGSGPLDSRAAFLGIHVAYAAACGQDPDAAAAVLYHRHTPADLSSLTEVIGDFRPILTYRNPLNAMASEYRRVDRLVVRPRRIAAKWKRFLQPLDPIPGEEVIVICLDDLKSAPEAVMGSFAHAIGIDYRPELLSSTWHGLQWWGDEQTSAFLPGLTSHGLGEKWVSEMPKWEAIGFAWILRWHIAELCGDEVAVPRSRSGPLLGLLVCLVPLRIEREVLASIIRQAVSRERGLGASSRLLVEALAAFGYRAAICIRAIADSLRKRRRFGYFARIQSLHSNV